MASTIDNRGHECGNTTRALEMNRQSMDGAHKRGDPETSANAKINLAGVLLTQGHIADAQEIANETYRIVKILSPATGCAGGTRHIFSQPWVI